MTQTIISTLFGLTIPLALVAIALGVLALIRATLLMRHSERLRRSPTAERVAMFLCALCGAAAAMMIVGAVQGGNYIVFSAALAQLAFAAAGVGMYFTQKRPLSEAFAAISLGIFSVLSGFSIGIYIAPFALAMGVLASHHLRIERRSPERQ